MEKPEGMYLEYVLKMNNRLNCLNRHIYIHLKKK